MRAPYPLAQYSTETYDGVEENKFRRPIDQPLSTFSIDVDTASYSNIRRFLKEGTLPPVDAVRVEEMLNYFSYAYPRPSGTSAFAADMEIAGKVVQKPMPRSSHCSASSRRWIEAQPDPRLSKVCATWTSSRRACALASARCR